MKTKIPAYINLEDKSLLTVKYDKDYSYLAYNDNAVFSKISIGSSNFSLKKEDTEVSFNTYGYNNPRILSGQSLYLDIDMSDTSIFKCETNDGLSASLPFIFYHNDNIYGMMTPQDVGSLCIRGKYSNDYNSDYGETIIMELTSLSPTTVSTNSLILGGLRQEDPNVGDFKLNPLFLIAPGLSDTSDDYHLNIIGGDIKIYKDVNLVYTTHVPDPLDSTVNGTKSIVYSSGVDNLGSIEYSTEYTTSGGSSTQNYTKNKLSFSVYDGSSLQSVIDLTNDSIELKENVSVDGNIIPKLGNEYTIGTDLNVYKKVNTNSVGIFHSNIDFLGYTSFNGSLSFNVGGVSVGDTQSILYSKDLVEPSETDKIDLGSSDKRFKGVYTKFLNGINITPNAFAFNSGQYEITLPLFSCVEAVYEIITSSSFNIDDWGTSISNIKTFLRNSHLYYSDSIVFPSTDFGDSSGYVSYDKITDIQSFKESYPPKPSGDYHTPSFQTRLYYKVSSTPDFYISLSSTGKYRIRIIGTQAPINNLTTWSQYSSYGSIKKNNDDDLGSVPDVRELYRDRTIPFGYIELYKGSVHDSSTKKDWYLYCQSVRCLIFRYE